MLGTLTSLVSSTSLSSSTYWMTKVNTMALMSALSILYWLDDRMKLRFLMKFCISSPLFLLIILFDESYNVVKPYFLISWVMHTITVSPKALNWSKIFLNVNLSDAVRSYKMYLWSEWKKYSSVHQSLGHVEQFELQRRRVEKLCSRWIPRCHWEV